MESWLKAQELKDVSNVHYVVWKQRYCPYYRWKE